MEYKKPQSTIIQGNVGIYPLTTADQVILADGTRLEKDGKINVDVANSANSAKLGGKAPEYYLQPRNLLDNSDFKNPVNQRGKTNYTGGGYTIDRWVLGVSAVVVNVLDDGIEVTGGDSSYNAPYIQKVPENLTGKTVTLAVCDSDGVIETVTGTVQTDSACSTNTTYGSITFYHASSDGTLWVQINVKYGGSKIFRWAALYEGSYTAETLPPYVPKGYAAELAECQRYFERIGKSGTESQSASMLMAVGNAGEMRVLQGYRVPKRIISPTIMVNGKAVGETVSVRNTMNNEFCTGVLSVWHNICADRLNTLTVAGTSVVGAVYEGYLDIIADL